MCDEPGDRGRNWLRFKHDVGLSGSREQDGKKLLRNTVSWWGVKQGLNEQAEATREGEKVGAHFVAKRGGRRSHSREGMLCWDLVRKGVSG